MVTGALSFLEKDALVPDAPGPVLPYSPNKTFLVLSSPVFLAEALDSPSTSDQEAGTSTYQIRHPAPLMTSDR